jgi:hypothetical protein
MGKGAQFAREVADTTGEAAVPVVASIATQGPAAAFTGVFGAVLGGQQAYASSLSESI